MVYFLVFHFLGQLFGQFPGIWFGLTGAAAFDGDPCYTLAIQGTRNDGNYSPTRAWPINENTVIFPDSTANAKSNLKVIQRGQGSPALLSQSQHATFGAPYGAKGFYHIVAGDIAACIPNRIFAFNITSKEDTPIHPASPFDITGRETVWGDGQSGHLLEILQGGKTARVWRLTGSDSAGQVAEIHSKNYLDHKVSRMGQHIWLSNNTPTSGWLVDLASGKVTEKALSDRVETVMDDGSLVLYNPKTKLFIWNGIFFPRVKNKVVARGSTLLAWYGRTATIYKKGQSPIALNTGRDGGAIEELEIPPIGNDIDRFLVRTSHGVVMTANTQSPTPQLETLDFKKDKASVFKANFAAFLGNGDQILVSGVQSNQAKTIVSSMGGPSL